MERSAAASLKWPEKSWFSKETDALPGTPSLLGLPPELRNQIYEYCLKSEYRYDNPWWPPLEVYPTHITVDNVEHMIVDSWLKLPALLSTCRKIRGEASKIWYLANRFAVIIEQHDPKILIAWEAHCRNVAERLGAKPQTRVSVDDSAMYPSWEYVMAWCRALWEGKITFVTEGLDGSLGRLVLVAQTIALESQELPWEKCERMLQAYRTVLGDIDEEWLKD